MGHPRFTDEEIDRRGESLYNQRIRSQVDTPANRGKQIVIDVETGDYEIDEDGLAASLRMLARRPGAALYGSRIGFDVVYSLGRVLGRTSEG